MKPVYRQQQCVSTPVWVLSGEKFLKQKTRETARIVADDPVLFEKVVQDHAIAEFLKLRQVDLYLFSTLPSIALSDFRGNGPAVGHNPIHDRARRVAADRSQMIGERVSGGFARLRHKIGNVHTGSLGLGNRGGDLRDQKIRKDAGVERARAEKNQVGLTNRIDDRRKGRNTVWRKRNSLNRRTAGGDVGFSAYGAAIRKLTNQVDIGKC